MGTVTSVAPARTVVDPAAVSELANRLGATSAALRERAVRVRALLDGGAAAAAPSAESCPGTTVRLERVARWSEDVATDLRWLVRAVTTADGAGEDFAGATWSGLRRTRLARDEGGQLARALLERAGDEDPRPLLELLGQVAQVQDPEVRRGLQTGLGPDGAAALVARIDQLRERADAEAARLRGSGNPLVDLLGGAWDSVWGGATAVVGLSVQVLWDPATVGRNWRDVGHAAQLAVEDPGAFLAAVVDTEQLRANPVRWVGSVAPDVAAYALGGVGAARLGARLADELAETSSTARRLVLTRRRLAGQVEALRGALGPRLTTTWGRARRVLQGASELAQVDDVASRPSRPPTVDRSAPRDHRPTHGTPGGAGA